MLLPSGGYLLFPLDRPLTRGIGRGDEFPAFGGAKRDDWPLEDPKGNQSRTRDRLGRNPHAYPRRGRVGILEVIGSEKQPRFAKP